LKYTTDTEEQGKISKCLNAIQDVNKVCDLPMYNMEVMFSQI